METKVLSTAEVWNLVRKQINDGCCKLTSGYYNDTYKYQSGIRRRIKISYVQGITMETLFVWLKHNIDHPQVEIRMAGEYKNDVCIYISGTH